MGAKKKKRMILVMVLLMVLIMINGLCFNEAAAEERLLLSTFRISGAKITGVQVNGWAVIDEGISNRKSLDAYMKDLMVTLFPLPDSMQVSINEAAGTVTESVEGRLKDEVTARLTLIAGLPKKGARENTIVLSLFSTGQDYPIQEMNKILNEFMENRTCQNSTIIKGYIPGEIDQKVQDEVIKKMVIEAKCHKVESMVNGHAVSISGFTPKLSELLTVEQKSVNINMALRYNSVENKTMVYLGTPIITCEY